MQLKDDFSNLEQFEEALTGSAQIKWAEFQEEANAGFSYSSLTYWEKELLKHGISFEWGLDAEPYNFEIKQQSNN